MASSYGLPGRKRKRPCLLAAIPGASVSRAPPADSVQEVERSLKCVLQASEQPEVVSATLHRIEAQESAAHGSNEALYCKLLELGAQLAEYGNRLARQHAAEMNVQTWPLTQDLSVKIFSMMGTHDCARAAVACTLFAQSVADPACYQVLDLVPCGARVTLPLVNMLVRRAGHFLRVLKLGILPRPPVPPAPQSPPLRRSSRRHSSLASSAASPDTPSSSSPPVRPDWVPVYENRALPQSRLTMGKEKGRLCPLPKQALQVLAPSQAGTGQLLTCLHLYNVLDLDDKALTAAIATCPRLEDLEVIGLNVSPAVVVEAVAANCPLLTRLCYQPCKKSALFDGYGPSAGRHPALRTALCERVAERCPHLTSLTLRSCILQDRKVTTLLKKLSLRSLDLCGAQYLTGSFLRELVSLRACPLEHLLLRDCIRLREDHVETFLHALMSNDYKALCSLDVSNRNGLAQGLGWYARRRSGTVQEAAARLPRMRPTFWLTADFPENSDSGSDSDGSGEETEDSDSLEEDEHGSEEESEGEEEEEEEDDEDDEDDEEEDDEGEGDEGEEEDDDDPIMDDDDDDEEGEDNDDDDDDDSDPEDRQLLRARMLMQLAQHRLDLVEHRLGVMGRHGA